MKKYFKFISLMMIFSIILSTSIVFAEDLKTVDSDKPIYLALGDSITYGYEPSDDPAEAMTGKQLTDECFVNILANAKGYTAINKGEIGNTAVGIKTQLDSGQLDDLIKQAQIITITCGGNDLMEVVYARAAKQFNASKECVAKWGTLTPLDIVTILALPSNYDDDLVKTVQMAAYAGIIGVDSSDDFKVALEQFIEDLNEMTATIKEKNPDVQIFLATQYNPYQHFSATYKAVGTYLGNSAKILRDRVIENAETGQYTVVDVYSAFLNNTETYCNATEDPLFLDFHPSVEGHAAIAECFLEVVPQAENKTVIPTEEDVVPNTGDNSIALPIITMLISATSLVIVEKKKKYFIG